MQAQLRQLDARLAVLNKTAAAAQNRVRAGEFGRWIVCRCGVQFPFNRGGSDSVACFAWNRAISVGRAARPVLHRVMMGFGFLQADSAIAEEPIGRQGITTLTVVPLPLELICSSPPN